MLIDSRNCECHKGMVELTLKYLGQTTASSIIGYYVDKKGENEEVLCSFYDVDPEDEITCSSGSLSKLKRRTAFIVSYDDDDDARSCSGDIKTKCPTDIIGDALDGCNDLVVLSFVDGDGALCDTAISAAEAAASSNNAWIGDEATLHDPLELFEGMDPLVRWTLIGAMVAFAVLMALSVFICVFKKKEKNENEDVIAASIAMTGLRSESVFDDDCFDEEAE